MDEALQEYEAALKALAEASVGQQVPLLVGMRMSAAREKASAAAQHVGAQTALLASIRERAASYEAASERVRYVNLAGERVADSYTADAFIGDVLALVAEGSNAAQ